MPFAIIAVCLLLVLSACSSGESDLLEQEVEANETVHHTFAPSDEMMRLARQQCEDSEIGEGVVEAKDSESGLIVSKAVVKC